MTNDPDKSRFVTGTDRRRLRTKVVRLYLGGATIRQIGRHIGRSYGLAYRLLVEADVQMRPRARRPKPKG